eukprot:6478606-Amphidinium_carterae.1
MNNFWGAKNASCCQTHGVGGNAGQSIKDLGMNRAFKRSALGAWTKTVFVAEFNNVWAQLKLSDTDLEAEALRARKTHEIHMFRPNKRGLVPEKDPAYDPQLVDEEGEPEESEDKPVCRLSHCLKSKMRNAKKRQRTLLWVRATLLTSIGIQGLPHAKRMLKIAIAGGS